MPKKTQIQISADISLLRKELRQAKEEFRSFNKNAVDSATGIRRIENEADRAGKKLSGFRKILSGIKSSLSGVFGKFTLAGIASNAITGAVFRIQNLFTGLVRGSIEASSALTELDSKARVVFKDAFDVVQRQSAAIAEEVGRANSAILTFATDIGAIFEANGIGGRALADMSTGIAKLAVDLASFNNTADEEAFRSLQSGLVGMVQPLRRFGVDLTQTSLKQFALNKGIDESVESMNQAQLMALRYAFILDTTTTAQGDAARTADSFANQTRRLEGEWMELNEELGKIATPALADGMGVLSRAIQGIRESVVDLTADAAGLVAVLNQIPGAGFIKNTVKNFLSDTVKGKLIPLPDLPKFSDVRSSIESRLSSPVLEGTIGSEGDTDIFSLISSLRGASSDKSGGKGGGEEAKKLFDELIKKRKEMLMQERDRLIVRKKLGVITEREEEMLRRINNRVEFSQDAIKEATQEWLKQVDALKSVQKEIDGLNESIGKEQEQLERTIENIRSDSSRRASDEAAELFRELEELRFSGSGAHGLSADQSFRIGEIESELRGFSEEDRAEGERLAGLGSAALIEEDKKRRIEDAQAEADARIESLQTELAKAEDNKQKILQLEEEKRQAVESSLNARNAVTFANYAQLEERTAEHVDQQIAEFERLRSAVATLTAAQTFGFSSLTEQGINSATAAGQAAGAVRRARGGPVFGAGGPTSDSIPAFLSNGEYVINAKATAMYRPLIEKINSMSIPRFAQGGAVTNNNQRSANVTINNHGRAAEVFAHPRRAAWVKRTFL
ncbi:hypothetical protein [Symmachiella dynata]|uniref:hypothetical protein n=1 Tax=Symmachiella dynata TaxID=2527995 RepID=UPI00119D3B53|nr:hypothetical protein [Symmachiella dynata]